MIPSEPRLKAALDAATNAVRTTLAAAVARVSEQLGPVNPTSVQVTRRDQVISAQLELRRNVPLLLHTFADELAGRVHRKAGAREEPQRKLATANWQTLSLVDDQQIEDRMYSDRIGQMIEHACESELRDMAAYMGTLMRFGHPDQDRNPLRPEVLGASLYRAIGAITQQAEVSKVLAQELGSAFANAMPECYAKIVRDLQGLGLEAMELTVRQVEGPGNQLPGITSGYSTLSTTRSQPGDLDSGIFASGIPPIPQNVHGLQGRTIGGYAARDTGLGGAPSTGAGTVSGPAARAAIQARTRTAAAALSLSTSQADAQLMALLRHLTVIASHPGELDLSAPAGAAAAAAAQRAAPLTGVNSGAGAGIGSVSADGLTELMAVNLIRTHREELLKASSGQLDHMVIDVVGSLFDQILSDSRVSPQMARQIARLQLPVLRVALNDPSFFTSRRHPVRRFVNRIASLACAFDDFGDGPGKHFLDRVRGLVQEIVEGDFDQIDLYTDKLAALEVFIADQTHRDAQRQGAAETLGGKEAELRLQQRYMLQLQGALTPLALPDYLRDFLAQVWTQALVLAVSRDGADSDRAKRYRRVGRDLVMSVQGKGSPALRKKFLMQLPGLMKDLNEGMALVGWPQAARQEFFAKLMPGQADSLKAPPQSELDHNMMVKQLEAIFQTAVPTNETLSPSDPVPDVSAEVLSQRFSEEEVQRVGLVTESAVNWSEPVDIDLPFEASASAPGDTAESSPISLTGIDLDLTLGNEDPAEPSRGPALFEHIKLGFAYQMHLKDEWQKVRLTHVSAGRGFFVFTRGKKHQETISMTARMLARMCESGRMRAVESAYLIERATVRARKQLAALGTPTRH